MKGFDYTKTITFHDKSGIVSLDYRDLMAILGIYRFHYDTEAFAVAMSVGYNGEYVVPKAYQTGEIWDTLITKSDYEKDEMTSQEKEVIKIHNFDFTLTNQVYYKEPGEPAEQVIVPNLASDKYVTINGMGSDEVPYAIGFYGASSIEIEYTDYNTAFGIGLEARSCFDDKIYKILLQFEYKPFLDSDKDQEDSEDSEHNSWVIIDNGEESGIKDHMDMTPDWGNIPESAYKYIFVNTYSLEDIYNEPDHTLHVGQNVARLYVDPRLHIYGDDGESPFTITMLVNGVQRVFTYNSRAHVHKSSGTTMNYPRLMKMNRPEVSYALLRTNPKLTGNVKVVVDSKNNIYLDTFKVSEALSQKKYRHIRVGKSEYYGQNLMSKFKSVSTTDFYKVEDKCSTLFTPAQTYKEEYYDIYRMGVKTNDDEMYSENYSIFAPICLKSYAPDFFLVFKIDKSKKSYLEDTFTPDEKIRYFFNNGTLVKSFDLRPESPVGEYLNTIIKRSEKFVGDMYESYSTDNYNKYIGISIDKGVVTSSYESNYPEENIKNQAALNDYYTRGFERNHLVSKNIINLEFMFDDPDAELFSINTYFGVYVKVNTQDDTYCCIGEETDEDGVTTNMMDRPWSQMNTLKDPVYVKNLTANGAIYGVTTPYEFIRLRSESIKTSPEVKKFARKPYRNIYNSPVYKENLNDDKCDAKAFLTFSLHKLLTVGDHLRIIDNSTKVIYEIIASGTEFYNDDYYLSNVITNQWPLTKYEYDIKRISFYLPETKNICLNSNSDIAKAASKEQTEEWLKTTVKCLVAAFNKFENSFTLKARLLDDFTIGLSSTSSDLIFERICSPSGFTVEQKKYVETSTTEQKDLSFFGEIYPEKLILDVETTKWESSDYNYLYPADFPLVGNRMAYAMHFVTPVNGTNKTPGIYYGEIVDSKIFDLSTILYQSNGEYVKYKNFMLKSPAMKNGVIADDDTTAIEVAYVPYYKDSTYAVLNVENPDINNSTLLLYEGYPLNDGLCSIFDIKDFDFEVLDAENIIFNNNSSYSYIGSMGEFTKEGVFSFPFVDEGEAPEEIDEIIYVVHKNMNELINKIEDNYADIIDELNEQQFFTPDVLPQDTPGEFVLKPYVKGSTYEDTGDYDYNRVISVPAVQYMYDETTDKTTVIWADTLQPIDIVRVGAFLPTEKYKEIPHDNPKVIESSQMYSPDPIRNTSEENIFNYVDKYETFNVEKDPAVTEGNLESSLEFLQRQLSNYYNSNHNTLDISLVSPFACKWKSIGTDSRGENLRLMQDYDSFVTNPEFKDQRSYYVSGPDSYSSYLGYLYYINKNTDTNGIFQKYVPSSVNAIYASEPGKGEFTIGTSLKDSILSGNWNLDDTLYDDKDFHNKMSVAYICGDNCLEFISSGVKLRIKSNNDNAIDLNNYHGYSAIFVSLPDMCSGYNVDTELIIDETAKEIMVIWYQPVNSFKYGASYYEKNNIFDFTGAMFHCRLKNDISFDDILASYALDVPTNTSYSCVKFPDTSKLANVGDRGKKLCDKEGYIYITTTGNNDSTFTKSNSIMIFGTLYPNKPFDIAHPDENAKYPYYSSEGFITGLNSKFWCNNMHGKLSNELLDTYTKDVYNSSQVYVITDNQNYIINTVGSYDDLKGALENHAVYIKTSDGKKDYTKLSNIIEMTAVDPIMYTKYKLIKEKTEEKGYVHSTYAEPVMKNITRFAYSGMYAYSGSFQKSFDGANIFIDGVDSVPQIWINKYTEEPNYCIQNADLTEEYKMSIDYLPNVSVMDSAWAKKLYRKYYSSEAGETYDNVDGYITGYEQKCFINSRGVQLTRYENGVTDASINVLEITDWKNTSISKSKGYIRLDISDSIVYKILNSNAFLSAWRYLNLTTNDYKINYIKKTILPLININNKTKFVISRTDIPTEKLQYAASFDESMIEVPNCKNELTYENGKYYMYIYPEEKYTYYAKMIIKL